MSCELIKLWARKCGKCFVVKRLVYVCKPASLRKMQHYDTAITCTQGERVDKHLHAFVSKKCSDFPAKCVGEKKKKKAVIFECNRINNRGGGLPAKFLRTCNFAHLHMGNSRTIPGTDIQKGIPPPDSQHAPLLSLAISEPPPRFFFLLFISANSAKPCEGKTEGETVSLIALRAKS